MRWMISRSEGEELWVDRDAFIVSRGASDKARVCLRNGHGVQGLRR